MDTIIRTTNLTKRFKNFVAVDNLNLNVYKGDVFGFLGPNGAGKSTSMRMFLNLIHPTYGEVFLFEKPMKGNFKELIRKVGAIVEKPDFYLYLSAYKNLEILGRLYGIDVNKKKIYELLELVGLEKRAKSKVKTYSHGMKQRLGLAQSLLHDPELIMLDEPTTGLDPQGMKEIRELILHLAKEKGKTVFLSSHLLNEVETVANRMIIINKGKVVVEGKVSELLNKENADYSFKLKDYQSAEQFLCSKGFTGEDYKINEDELVLVSKKIEASELNKLFVTNNIEVLSFAPQRSLEKYFLSLIKED